MADGSLSRRLAPLSDTRFRLLFLATFGSGLGNWLAVVALQIDVYDRTHSGWWVGALLAGSILPAVFLGVIAGPLVDALSRKSLMIASDLGRLGVFALLPFTNSVEAIVALAVLAGIGNAFFRPAVLAGLPNLVGSDELPAANALLQIVDWATTALGPLAGGAIVAASGPDLAYWINACTFALSAMLVALIPARLLQSDRSISRGHWRDVGEGWAVVRSSQALMCVLVAWSIAFLAFGIINVAEVFLAKQSYNAGDFGFGLLWAATGVGLVAGAVAAPGLIATRGLSTAYVRVLCVYAFGIAGAAAAPNVWVGAAAMVLAGFANGCAVVANITFVQKGAPDRVRGRAFTLLISANYTVLGIGFLVAGPLTKAVGARWAYAVAAVTMLVAALVASRFARHAESETRSLAEAT